MERVWFDGKDDFAVDLGRVAVSASGVKVAQEYQIVYAVELDEKRPQLSQHSAAGYG